METSRKTSNAVDSEWITNDTTGLDSSQSSSGARTSFGVYLVLFVLDTDGPSPGYSFRQITRTTILVHPQVTVSTIPTTLRLNTQSRGKVQCSLLGSLLRYTDTSSPSFPSWVSLRMAISRTTYVRVPLRILDQQAGRFMMFRGIQRFGKSVTV